MEFTSIIITDKPININQSSINAIVVIVICVFFVYLIMVALYESLFIPLAVILGVPFGLMGALLFAQLFGVENNIYLQVGLIMLIGLLFVVPALFVLFQTLQERFKPVEFIESEDPLIVEELKHIKAYHAAKAEKA